MTHLMAITRIFDGSTDNWYPPPFPNLVYEICSSSKVIGLSVCEYWITCQSVAQVFALLLGFVYDWFRKNLPVVLELMFSLKTMIFHICVAFAATWTTNTWVWLWRTHPSCCIFFLALLAALLLTIYKHTHSITQAQALFHCYKPTDRLQHLQTPTFTKWVGEKLHCT